MAEVRVTAGAQADVQALIEMLSLPEDTWARVVAAWRLLESFPHAGPVLPGHEPLRAIRGPWRWMLTVYEVDDERVHVLAVFDARSSVAPL